MPGPGLTTRTASTISLPLFSYPTASDRLMLLFCSILLRKRAEQDYNTDLRTVRISAGGGAITANGRPSSTDVSYYVINKSSVSTSESSTAGSGTAYLGRPWSEYARVCFQNTVLGAVINSAGWEIWSTSTPNTADVTFQEYGNTGTGASGTRASFSTKLSSAISISTILGSTYTGWVDTSYLA